MGVRMATGVDDAQAARELERVAVGLPAGLDVAWLGMSGYRLTYAGVSLFVDPYGSRVPLRALLLRRRALPDPAMIERYTGTPGAVAGVLVGHTHFDHAVTRPRSRGATAPRPTGRRRWRTSCGSTASASPPSRSSHTSPTSSAPSW